MEGRLTWYPDDQTSLHPMFNITTEAVNWYEYESIYSVPGTFTDGMFFEYDMTQPYNNYFLHAVPPAFELFNALPDSRALMVAYDAGDYKTIGSNMEFGGLVDGSEPSTKKELMEKILQFFGDIMTETDEFVASGENQTLRVFPNPSAGFFNLSFNLKESGHVRLEITDMAGQLIACPFDNKLPAGNHTLTWKFNQDNETREGIYLFRLITGTEIHPGKLILTQ
jgi:hypothetical protein